MRFGVASTLALSTALASTALAGTFSKPVIELGVHDFTQKVLAQDRPSMVVFYAPWCGHCKSLAPEFQQAASSLDPLIPFYSVNCDDDQNKPLCAQYEVKGFPTIKSFSRGGKLAPKDYQSERKKGPLVGYASGLVGEKVEKLRVPSKGGVSGKEGVQQVEKFLSKDNGKPHALLIHPVAASIPLMWKVLAQLTPGTTFGFIRDADRALQTELELPPLDDVKPRILLWEKGAELSSWTLYEGALKYEYLSSHFHGTPVPPSSSSSSSSSSSTTTESTDRPNTSTAPNAINLQRAAERAKAEAKWAAEEAKDVARRAKLEAKRLAAQLVDVDESSTGTGTGTEAPAPQVPEVPSASSSASVDSETAASPEPPSDETPRAEPANEPKETDSLVGSEQINVVGEQTIGGVEEEIVPEFKVDDVRVKVPVDGQERKRDEL